MSEQPVKISSWFKPWWKGLLVIALFPFTLSYFIWKQNWKTPIRLGAVVVLWIIFIALGSSGPSETSTASETDSQKQAEVVATSTPEPSEVPQNELNLQERLDILAKKKIDKKVALAYDEQTGLATAELSTADHTFLNNTDMANRIWNFFIPFATEAFKYEGVNQIKVSITTEFVDGYGKSIFDDAVYVDMTKEDFLLFNWENLRFTNPQENQQLLEKSNYYINGVIYKDIKPDKLKISFL